MLQPFRLALPLALALAWGTAAHAEPPTGGRVRRERPVTVASTAGEPLPVVHIAQDTPTLFLFPSPIQRKSLTFDESWIRVLDAGERSVIVQAVSDPRKDEQQEMGVFFAHRHAAPDVRERRAGQAPQPPHWALPVRRPGGPARGLARAEGDDSRDQRPEEVAGAVPAVRVSAGQSRSSNSSSACSR
ncbi:DUF2381 family protein [Corallococcus sp. AB032C]|nr:DUF2381 family protein [Corallococcus exiguus]RKH76674.1 DUF2381 family protein [Corallococcus sp. AB032C]